MDYYEYEDEFDAFDYEFDGEDDGEFEGEGFDDEAMYLDEFDDEAMYLDEFDAFDDEADFLSDETGPLVKGTLARKMVKKVKQDARKSNASRKRVAHSCAKVAGAAAAGAKGAKIASAAAKKVAKKAARDGEDVYEADGEGDFEAMGGDLALYKQMQYLANRAAETESEAEADEFLGALAGLAGPLLTSLVGESETDWEDGEDYFDEEGDEFFGALAAALPVVAKLAAPLVKRGVKAVGKALRSKRTRNVIRRLPGVALNTATSLARQAQRGRITPSRVAATLGRETYRTFCAPGPYRRRRRRSRRRPAPQYQAYN